MTIKPRSKKEGQTILMAEDSTITMQAAADLLGISYQALKKWKDEGMPVADRGGPGIAARVHMRDIMAWREGRAEERIVAQRVQFNSSPEEMDAEGGRKKTYVYEEERARKTAWQATIAEVEALKAMGRVVDIDVVAKLVEDEFAEIRAGLLNLPASLAVPLSAMTDEREIAEKIRQVVTEILGRLSGADEIGPMARDGKECRLEFRRVLF